MSTFSGYGINIHHIPSHFRHETLHILLRWYSRWKTRTQNDQGHLLAFLRWQQGVSSVFSIWCFLPNFRSLVIAILTLLGISYFNFSSQSRIVFDPSQFNMAWIFADFVRYQRISIFSQPGSMPPPRKALLHSCKQHSQFVSFSLFT